MRIGEKKVYSLQYANDIVLMPKRENEMRIMLESQEGYLDKKKLEVNTDKTRIIRFRGEGGE